MTTKVDYNAEVIAYLESKPAGKKETQADFCQRRSAELGKIVSFEYFKKKLKSLRKGARKQDPAKEKASKKKAASAKTGTPPPAKTDGYDWKALKTDFFNGKFKSLSGLARHIGAPPTASWFRRKTAGWANERKQFIEASNAKTVEALKEARVAERIRGINVEILTIQYKIMDMLNEAAEDFKNWEHKHKTPWFTREAINVAIAMQTALEKIIPNIHGLQKLDQVQQIFKGLKDGTMCIAQAAIEFAMLGVEMPTPVKMLLAKQPQNEETPTDDGDEITDEMIMARRTQMMGEIETERVAFTAERQRIVTGMKKELAGSDSFAVQAALETDGTEKL